MVIDTKKEIIPKGDINKVQPSAINPPTIPKMDHRTILCMRHRKEKREPGDRGRRGGDPSTRRENQRIAGSDRRARPPWASSKRERRIPPSPTPRRRPHRGGRALHDPRIVHLRLRIRSHKP